MMRRFKLERDSGFVAEGVLFSDGHVVVRWFGPAPSTVLWTSFTAFESVSVKQHAGQGRIVWLD